MFMDKKKSEFDKVFSAWDILVIAFGAMIGWGWVVSSGTWIDAGGVVGAALLTIIYGMIFKSAMQIDQTHVWIMAGISAVGALISMVGDLTASAIKRNYEIKDYGKLIPGHGGILDRFDSVIFTAPIIYFLAVNFIKL